MRRKYWILGQDQRDILTAVRVDHQNEGMWKAKF